LRPNDDLHQFDCGIEEMNLWLRTRATRSLSSGDAVAWGVFDDGMLAGFYALAPVSAQRGEAGGMLDRNAPEQVPALLLARLGVDRRHQRHGLGRALVADAAERARAAASQVGGRALLVDAKNPEVAAWYGRLGFRAFRDDQLRLYLMF
jgi:GNAT superfamily N-acetyltransferase